MEQRVNRSMSSLPGVGDRLDVVDVDGNAFCAIRLHDGRVELHSGDQMVELDEIAASSVGAFISGHYRMPPEIADRLASVLGGLVFDWVRLEQGDAAVGKSIEELDVGRQTDISIVAILRGSIPIVAPDPAIELQVGDDLVIAGKEQDLERFGDFMTRGC